MSTKKNALGKGLGALLESARTDITSKDEGNIVGSVSNIPLSQIQANPFQPRTDFETERLLELSNSIREQGLIQPVTVRKMGYDSYQLISGERRLRASQIAGLTTIPAYIRIANDQAMLEMALVENIQRENLNAIEIALSYKRLIEECNLTQEELSKRVGKERSTITNYIRLLKLPAEVQAAIRDNKISMGHARALLSLESESKQLSLLNDIVNNQLSVRQVEELSRSIISYKNNRLKNENDLNAWNINDITSGMTHHFGSPVKLIVTAKGTGRIVIPFKSKDDLERILRLIEKE